MAFSVRIQTASANIRFDFKVLFNYNLIHFIKKKNNTKITRVSRVEQTYIIFTKASVTRLLCANTATLSYSLPTFGRELVKM